MKREEAADRLLRVTRMILEELESMPEYEQLRLLAEIVERKIKKLEAQQKEKCLSPGRGHRDEGEDACCGENCQPLGNSGKESGEMMVVICRPVLKSKRMSKSFDFDRIQTRLV